MSVLMEKTKEKLKGVRTTNRGPGKSYFWSGSRKFDDYVVFTSQTLRS